MKGVYINLPYVELSFGVLSKKSFEKSFLTPFGVINIVATKKFSTRRGAYYYEISLSEPLLNRLSEDFKKSLRDFVKHLAVYELTATLPSYSGEDFVIKI